MKNHDKCCQYEHYKIHTYWIVDNPACETELSTT